MAVSRKTQKDIGNYEAKFLGPFTARQSALIAMGSIPTAISYFIIYGITGDKMIGSISLIFMVPFAFFAFGKSICYGMKPEDFLLEYYFYHIKSPVKRRYKTETLDDILEKQRLAELKKEAMKEASKSKKKKKKSESKEELSFVPEGTFKAYPHKEDSEFRSFE